MERSLLQRLEELQKIFPKDRHVLSDLFWDLKDQKKKSTTLF